SEIAVTSSRPSSAHWFSVWMSLSTCSNSNPRGSTSPLARPQNMKASSGSGLWPRRTLMRVWLFRIVSTGHFRRTREQSPRVLESRRKRRLRGRASLPAAEPTLERPEQLLPRERLDVFGPAVVLGHADVVVQDPVRLLQDVLELVSLEDVVVRAWFVARPVLRIDGTPDGPHPAFLALDPDDDALLRSGLVEPVQLALREPRGGRQLAHGARIQSPSMARLAALFRNPFSFLFTGSSHEDRVSAARMRQAT